MASCVSMGCAAMKRCSARSKRTGQRCRRLADPGANVCVMHGAGSPKVQEAARERFAALARQAIDTLQRAMRSKNLIAGVRAARDLLDRAGPGVPRAWNSSTCRRWRIQSSNG